MTQRILVATVKDQSGTVLMGWDRPLQQFFMVVQVDKDDADEPLYSNLNDPDLGVSPQLSYFAGKAAALGISLPQQMLARLDTDRALNLGNASSTFDVNGNETS